MSEIVNDRQVFSLLEVTRSIQKTIVDRYKSAFWVKAEMNKLNHYSQSGHCFPELVEKANGKVIAEIKSTLWRDDYLNINNNFIKTLKEPLKDGIKILFLAKVNYTPTYGLSLQILDIDPSYTLGDLEREKQETIKKLKSENSFDKNKKLRLPLLPQRIAIISVESSKGYADFLRVLDTNSWGYKFFHYLFPSILQGENAVKSMLSQLKRIEKVKSHFDVVAIIRGGGGDVGLSCYNNYSLAKAIAEFPLPVITGIGHATNETVVEMISSTNAITPTKIAEFLLQKFHNFSVPLQRAQDKIIDKSRRLLMEENTRFNSEVKLFKSVTENILLENRNDIKGLQSSIVQQIKFIFNNSKEQLNQLKKSVIRETLSYSATKKQELLQFLLFLRKDSSIFFDKSQLELLNIEKNINNMSPQSVLKRGFSITSHNGKAIKNVLNLKEGEVLETKVFEGTIKSIIKSTYNKSDNE